MTLDPSRYIAGKSAPVQKWLRLPDPLPPCNEEQMQMRFVESERERLSPEGCANSKRQMDAILGTD